jgi:hypothetical protein
MVEGLPPWEKVATFAATFSIFVGQADQFMNDY